MPTGSAVDEIDILLRKQSFSTPRSDDIRIFVKSLIDNKIE